MHSVIRYTTAVPPPLAMQIIGLSMENVQDLSMSGILPESPLYEISQAMMAMEIGSYLSAIGVPGGGNGEVLVATHASMPGQAVGYLLYMPLTDTAGQCGVNYGAVLKGMRGKGVFSALVKAMLDNYPSASLSCAIQHVSLYERLGFHVYGHRETQILMTTQKCIGEAKMPVVDINAFDDHPLIQSAQASTVAKHGAQKIHQALFAQTLEVEAKAKAAENFAKARLAR